MNRRNYIKEVQAIQRRYEVKYFPKVKKAIQSKVDEVKSIVNSQGIQAAISHLNKELQNVEVTKIIQTLALEVGLRFARRQWISLQDQKRTAKKSIIFNNTITCPHCKKPTSDVESGMGYIKCSNCGKTFSSNQKSFSFELKGFGFNAEWVAWIKNFLFQFIVEKISFSVFETTKDTLFRVLNEAITGGWGIDKTVEALDELNLSDYQAARIVRTEITRAANAGAQAAGSTFPYQQQKEWISAHDNRVRGVNPKDHADHRGLDGQVVDYEDVFRDPRNGDELICPGDPNASAASTINCRCSAPLTAKIDENGRLIPKRVSTAVIYPTNRRRTIITI